MCAQGIDLLSMGEEQLQAGVPAAPAAPDAADAPDARQELHQLMREVFLISSFNIIILNKI